MMVAMHASQMIDSSKVAFPHSFPNISHWSDLQLIEGEIHLNELT